jgi:hypothetical protein
MRCPAVSVAVVGVPAAGGPVAAVAVAVVAQLAAVAAVASAVAVAVGERAVAAPPGRGRKLTGLPARPVMVAVADQRAAVVVLVVAARACVVGLPDAAVLVVVGQVVRGRHCQRACRCVPKGQSSYPAS